MATYNVTIENIDLSKVEKQKEVLMELQINKGGEKWEAIEDLLNLLDTITDKVKVGECTISD